MKQHSGRRVVVPAVACLGTLASVASAQLRVCNWNVTNYSGASARDPHFQNAIYGIVPSGLDLAGASMSPDIIIGEEFISQSGVNNFQAILNTAPGSPGDWQAAAFIDGPDTDTAFFYRASKVTLVRTVTVSQVTGSTSLPPRNTNRYDVRLNGYVEVPGVTLACYASHMKAGEGSTDQSRRLLEANKIRDNANGLNTNGANTALPAGVLFLFGADTNIQSSSQAAYQRLIGSEAVNLGRFFDPIKTPGSWNNNGAFRFVHTQDPAVQMDDRHDQLLICSALIDADGFDYIGDPNTAYSTTTWNDPNHTYRSWGNDGTSFDHVLTIAGNTMVGPSIAQSLVTSANGLGHLPVYLDFRVPPRVTSDIVIDFGSVVLDSVAEQPLLVANAGDVALWTASGIADLQYTLAASAGLSVPAGLFADAAGGAANTHVIAMDTSSLGPVSGQVTITSNAPDEPVRIVTIVGTVVGCPADFNGDGFVTGEDFDDYLAVFEAGDPEADFNGDGFVTGEDFDAFLVRFESGC